MTIRHGKSCYRIRVLFLYCFVLYSLRSTNSTACQHSMCANGKKSTESLSQNMAQNLTSTKNSLLQTKICSYLNMYQRWLNELQNSHQSRASARFIRNSGMLRQASLCHRTVIWLRLSACVGEASCGWANKLINRSCWCSLTRFSGIGGISTTSLPL